MARPRLLDLFCGAGGAAMGYHRAGFDVVGVDIAPQPDYPFRMSVRDALEVACTYTVDAIHASPPCQRYSHAGKLHPGSSDRHPDLISATRDLLEWIGLPYVIENVEGARDEMRDPYMLCGSMFGLTIRRHRLFETNWPMMVPSCHHGVENGYPKVHLTTTRRDGLKHRHGIVNPAATGARENVEALRDAMEVGWMQESRGIMEAIPPAYTELIGHQLIAHLLSGVAVA